MWRNTSTNYEKKSLYHVPDGSYLFIPHARPIHHFVALLFVVVIYFCSSNTRYTSTDKKKLHNHLYSSNSMKSTHVNPFSNFFSYVAWILIFFLKGREGCTPVVKVINRPKKYAPMIDVSIVYPPMDDGTFFYSMTPRTTCSKSSHGKLLIICTKLL
jgi:hypothetical protein